MEEKSFIERNKLMIVGVIGAIIIGALAFIFMMKSEPVGAVEGNAKVDQSKKVKSNVGDTSAGGDNLQLEGISVGGNFNLDKSEKTTTDSSTKNSTSKNEEVNEGND